VVNLAGPTYLGLLIFAAMGAIAGFLTVHLGWRMWVGQRWTRRRRRRAKAGEELGKTTGPSGAGA
jgi:uncharacterized protein (DUF2062 family)